jgi:hypothetical protein
MTDRPPRAAVSGRPLVVGCKIRFTLTGADSSSGIPAERPVRCAGQRKTLYVVAIRDHVLPLGGREALCQMTAASTSGLRDRLRHEDHSPGTLADQNQRPSDYCKSPPQPNN